jgi:two-component system NtrC family sensor kinase
MKQHYSASLLLRCLCLLLLSLLAPPALPAQIPAPDAGRRLSLTDTTRVRQLQTQADSLSPLSPQRLALTQQALALAQQLRDAPGQAAAWFQLTYLYRVRTQYGPARQAAQQAQQRYARLGNKGQEARSYMALGATENAQGNYVPALTLGLQGLRLAEQTGDPKILCRLQGTLGQLYTNLQDYPAALSQLRAAQHNAQQAHDPALLAVVLAKFADVYAGQKNWPESLRYSQQALSLQRQLHDEGNENVNLSNIADTYRALGRYALARAYARQAYAQAVAIHNTKDIPIIQLTLAQVYEQLGQPDSSLALARPSFALAQQQGDKPTLREASDLLARLSARRGEYEAAYRYRSLAAAYKDTLTGETTQRQTAGLRYGYELEKKQSQIALLTKRARASACSSTCCWPACWA